MPCPTVVVVGASAGGLEAVRTLVAGLPSDFPAAVFVVIHRGTDSPTLLRDLLSRMTRLPVAIAADGERIAPGRVYVAPVDRHVLLEDSRVRVTRGPRQHGFRPAVDPLFISAAQAYGDCVAGVILSGALDDGTAGMLAIKRRGGITLVQKPEEALVPGMPSSVLKNVEVDGVLPASEIARRLVALTAGGETSGGRTGGAGVGPSNNARSMGYDTTPEPEGRRKLTPFTCPDCGGALWEVEQENVDQYECHVGHRFGSEAMMALVGERTENILWSAVRALREEAALKRRMAARAATRGMHAMVERWQVDARGADRRARRIRTLIEAMSGRENEGEALPGGVPGGRAPRTRIGAVAADAAHVGPTRDAGRTKRTTRRGPSATKRGSRKGGNR